LAWYEFDLNWYAIWLLKNVGLARHVYRVRLDALPSFPPLTHAPEAMEVAHSPAAIGD